MAYLLVEHIKGDYFIMSKKTLNESVVRRFMGLANIQPTVVSNYLKENFDEEEEVQEEGMYGEEDEAPADAEMPPDEEPPMDEPAPEMDAEMDAEMPPEEMGGDEGSPELEITQEEALVLAGVLEKLTAAMPGEEEAPMEEPPMDAEMPPEDEMPPEGGDEGEEAPPEDEMLERALAGTSLDLSEDEVVQEVARRVANRILKAKRAQRRTKKTLGNNKK